MAVRQRYRRQQIAARRAGERWLAVIVALVCILALPARADECPPGAPPAVDRRACAELARCLRAEPTTSSTVSLTRQLVQAAERFERCALRGWSVAVGEREARQALEAARLTAAPVEAVDARPLLVDVLSHGGACAACGAGVALGAWAACRGGP